MADSNGYYVIKAEICNALSGLLMREGLASTWSPTNVGNTLAEAFTGGGDYQGAISAFGAQTGTWLGNAISEKMGKLTGNLGGKLGGLLGGALGVALPVIGPLFGEVAGTDRAGAPCCARASVGAPLAKRYRDP